MPKPPRACACGRLVPDGTRCACQIASSRERNARHDANRPTAAQRGYNHEWRKARAAFLALHPSCACCYAPATVVDHIIPHRGDDALFWNRQNWQALCASPVTIGTSNAKSAVMFDDHAHRSPEQDLWCAVLLSVVDDALFGPSRRDNGTRAIAQALRAGYCHDARDCLTRPSRDLALICACAGLDMRAVIDCMTRLIAAAPLPEELVASEARHNTRALTVKVKPEPKAKKGPKRYTYEGESLTLAEWSERTGLALNTLRSRIEKHWPIERVLTEPRGYRVKRPRKEQPRPATAGTRARTLTHAGETMILRQSAARLWLRKPTIDKRLRAGWPIEQVLSPENMRGKRFAGRTDAGCGTAKVRVATPNC